MAIARLWCRKIKTTLGKEKCVPAKWGLGASRHAGLGVSEHKLYLNIQNLLLTFGGFLEIYQEFNPEL